MGWGGKNFVNNFMWDFTNLGLCSDGQCNFLYVFSIIFPAVTGIMEGMIPLPGNLSHNSGANLSGDLADPHRSIWRGTFMAIGGSFFCYIVCMVAFAGGYNRNTLQVIYDSTLEYLLLGEFFCVPGYEFLQRIHSSDRSTHFYCFFRFRRRFWRI